MLRFRAIAIAVSLAIAALSPGSFAQQTDAPDLTKQPTLYVVGYAHLDTEWRWEYPQVINQYIRNTMEDNFKLFEKYPHYVFNFSGANRYRFIKEYFPADFALVQRYVKEGRWFPAGSSVEELTGGAMHKRTGKHSGSTPRCASLKPRSTTAVSAAHSRCSR